MDPKDESIQKLKNQLDDWNAHMNVLAARQEEASVAANQFARELDELRIKHRTLLYRLRELERTDFNIWENIGDGG